MATYEIINLTKTEIDIFFYLLENYSIKQIATYRQVSDKAIKAVITRLLQKFNVYNTKELFRLLLNEPVFIRRKGATNSVQKIRLKIEVEYVNY